MASNIAQMCLERYLNTDVGKKRPHIKQGRRDGKNNKPSSDSDSLSNYELGLIDDAKSSWSKYKKYQQDELGSASSKMDHEEFARDETSADKIDNLNDAKQKELENFTTTDGPGSSKQKLLNEEYEESIEDVRKIKTLLNRPLQTQFVRSYLPFMIILAIIETPINRLAFELFFQDESQFIAFALSAAIGSIIVFFAHVCGTHLKYSTCKEAKPNLFKTYFLIIFVAIFSLLLMWIIAQMRQQYIEFTQTGQELPTLQSLQQGDVLGGLAKDFFKWDLGIAGYLLLLANIAIFTVGFIAAYLRHDSHQDYEKTYIKERQTKSYRDKQKRYYDTRFAKINSDYNEKIDFIKRDNVTIDQNLEKYKSDKESLKSLEESDFNIVVSSLRKEIRAYRQGNGETRSTPEPNYFKSIDDNFLKDQIKNT